MPLYFFKVFNVEPSTPPASEEFPDDDAAWKEATRFAAELFRDIDGKLRPGDGWKLEVSDEAGRPIFSIHVITKDKK